jgi:hypothetical protein
LFADALFVVADVPRDAAEAAEATTTVGATFLGGEAVTLQAVSTDLTDLAAEQQLVPVVRVRVAGPAIWGALPTGPAAAIVPALLELAVLQEALGDAGLALVHDGVDFRLQIAIEAQVAAAT